jgi:hypothetical protein
VDLKRGDGCGPDNSAVVVTLFDDCSHHLADAQPMKTGIQNLKQTGFLLPQE